MNILEEAGIKASRKPNNDWYFFLFCVILILRVFFWFSPSHAEKVNFIYLWPLAIASAAVLVTRTPELRQWTFALPVFMVIWLWVGCMVNGDPYLLYNRGFILGIFLSFISSFLFIPSQSGARRERGLEWIAILYCALLLMVACLGLFVALTGNTFQTAFSDEAIRMKENRLYFFHYHPNEAASAFVVALYLIMYLFASHKTVWKRIVLVLSGAAVAWAIGFTGCRTAIFLAAAGISAWVFIALDRHPFQNRVWLRWVVRLSISAFVMVGFYFGITLSTNLIVKATPPTAVNTPQSTASTAIHDASKPETVPIQHDQVKQTRDARAFHIQDINTLNRRTEIWQSGLGYLKNHPRAYLFGVPDNIVARIPQQVGRAETHMHNAFIEMLLLGGIPGLAMYLSFLAILAYNGIRLAMYKGSCWGRRFLGIVPLLLAANGITEIYPLFSGNVMDMMYFVISGAVIAFAKDLPPAHKRFRRKAELPHVSA